VYRGAFETKRLKEAQLAMMSAKLPVVQRLALTIRNDRSRLQCRGGGFAGEDSLDVHSAFRHRGAVLER
jgi:hypothetical protein